MLKHNFLLVLSFLILIIIKDSQAGICEDSTKKQVPEKKIKLFHSVDFKKSFLASQKVNVYGFKGGMQYKDKFRAGLGIYFQGSPATVKYTFPEDLPRTVNAKFDFTYLTLFYEPIVFRNHRWELSVPTHLGIGTAKLSYMDSTNVVPIETTIYKKSAGVTEVCFMAEYKLFRWIGFGSGVGLRLVITNDEIIKDNLNAPVYVFKTRIQYGELYKMYKERRKKRKR